MELLCYHLPSAKPIVLRTYIQAFIISPFLFCCYANNLLLYFLQFLLLFLITFIPSLILHALFCRSRVSWVSFDYHWFFFYVLASLFHELLGVGVTLADWSGTNVSYATRKFVPSCLWKSSFAVFQRFREGSDFSKLWRMATRIACMWSSPLSELPSRRISTLCLKTN
jgi:hypothetical protein